MINSVFFANLFLIDGRVAALPPEVQSQREIEAIKKDPRLAELIGNSTCEIRKTETGYLVVTDWCELPIAVHYLPREDGSLGPVRFELIFGNIINK